LKLGFKDTLQQFERFFSTQVPVGQAFRWLRVGGVYIAELRSSCFDRLNEIFGGRQAGGQRGRIVG